MTSDHAGLVGRQEDRRVCDVFGLDQTELLSGKGGLGLRSIRQHSFNPVGTDASGRDGVDADAVLGPWISYLSRASYMLQQGRFVADIAYHYGEDSNITAIFGEHNPSIPECYNFDYVNADKLEHKLKVDHGDLTTDSGMRYRVLALDPCAQHMSLPVLRRISELVHQGVTVVASAPTNDPSLADDQASFNKLVAEFWGTHSEPSRKVGKGRVLIGSSLAEALKPAKLPPDTTTPRPLPTLRCFSSIEPCPMQRARRTVDPIVRRWGPKSTVDFYRFSQLNSNPTVAHKKTRFTWKTAVAWFSSWMRGLRGLRPFTSHF